MTQRVAPGQTAVKILSRLITGLLIISLPTAAVGDSRLGAWVDTVIAVEEPSEAAAISRLEANDIQAYFSGSANPEVARRVRRSQALTSVESHGSYAEITFNPVGPRFPAARLNPFAVPRIREAMNWLVDREYITREIMGGTGSPRYLPIGTVVPDYARLADVARTLELRYAPNPQRARSVITEEMGKLGATLVGGKWRFRGQPVTLIFLIRTEDERRQVGDYIAGLLESIGFRVERRYGRAAELGPLWISGDPAAGRWHLYTGSWTSVVTSRDDADTFDYFYTARGLSDPLWQAYKPSKEFDTASKTLAQRRFRTLEERRKLFGRALGLAMQDSARIWLYERISTWPRRTDVQLVSDISGGVSGSLLWPYTLRITDRPGGTVKIAVPSMLTDPWNPIGGSDWIFDTTLYNATQDHATLYNPFTGLGMPQRFQRAEVFVQQGLPVTKSADWVTLTFVPAIRVPPDAIISWDAKAQRFITVGEKYPRGLSAKTKAVAYFPKDLFEKSQWHDGSRLSLGDMLLSLIVAFDRAMPASAIFDPSVVPAFESFQETFRGLRIASVNPLIVESYSDSWLLDAEEIAHGAADALWPSCGSGPCPWHTLALGIRVEAAGAATFTAAKAAQRKVERMNYIAGPTLALLDRQMEAARVENAIPYRPTLSRYITAEEARERWTSLARWREARGHYWIGLGPFLLQRVAPVEKIVELRRFDRFPDPAARWIAFDEPRIPAVTGSGPAAVKLGGEARFDVRITFKGRPYAPSDIAEVKFLTFNAKGALAATGNAVADDGVWKIVLPPQVTRTLVPGSNRLEIIVVARVVNKPSFSAITFTTLP